jgi:hypothetical protein
MIWYGIPTRESPDGSSSLFLSKSRERKVLNKKPEGESRGYLAAGAATTLENVVNHQQSNQQTRNFTSDAT